MPESHRPLAVGVAQKDRLNGWLVVRLLPKMQRVVVGRFRRHSDAEGHLQALRRLMPEAQLVIMFDCDVDETRSLHLAISKAK